MAENRFQAFPSYSWVFRALPEAAPGAMVGDNPADAWMTLHASRQNNLANKIRVVRDIEKAFDFLFTGRNFRALKSQAPPRIVLLDLKLPKADGLIVLRAAKGDIRTRGIPFVVLTSSKEETDIVDSYSLGVNSYIQKPVDSDDSRQTVRQLAPYWLLVSVPPPSTASITTSAETNKL